MQKIGITDTVLRDAHQSLMATRMSIEDMIPVLELLDEIGYDSLECWGGATFDSCIRFLDEDPWERLRTIKSKVKRTPLQMLLRGQNLLGYRHYADDVVRRFIEKSAINGIDIFRVFDALNDLRNLETSVDEIKRQGKHAQLTICYTISDVHTHGYYQQLAKDMESIGGDSICIKDMAGILTPRNCFELVSKIKGVTDMPVAVHTHCTSGIAQMTYLAAVEAGATRIDTALSPFSEGTSQPPSESMAICLKEAGYEVSLDLAKMEEAANYFTTVKDKYLAEKILDPKMLTPDPKALIYQVPGGMLSNLFSQLKQANAIDRYDDVLKEVPRVREDLGFPPLVTPLSQMVGTQAAMNVLTGERYKMVSNEVKSYLLGEYGKSPVEIDPAFRTSIVGDKTPITSRPADQLADEFDVLANEISDYADNDEEVLIYALFPQVGKDFLEKKKNKTITSENDGKVFKLFGYDRR